MRDFERSGSDIIMTISIEQTRPDGFIEFFDLCVRSLFCIADVPRER
jgi:hypothetical protein